MMPGSSGGTSRRWIAGFWGVFILLTAASSFANANDAGAPISIFRALWLGVGAWGAWALATPVIVGLGQRWPVDRHVRWRFVAGHLAAAAAIGVLTAAATAAAGYDGRSDATMSAHVLSRVTTRWTMGAFVYFVILGVSYLAINTHRLREREIVAERLSRALSEAQLSALRMQLEPHFLFNSLNAIIALVRDRSTERADRALVVLSRVLRTALQRGARPRVRLDDEVAFIKNYLEIETIRFGDRLRVEYAVPIETVQAAVPTFILQPLVENALKHGLMERAHGGTLEITAERRDRALVLRVADDGVGLASEWQARPGGVGLANIRARLAHMYGGAGRLMVESRADRGGTLVTVELPFDDAIEGAT